ncbi:MFS general substrate transporter [Venturia nashicola]|nr:MFS general substrate transporter [Venturia nashicola]
MPDPEVGLAQTSSLNRGPVHHGYNPGNNPSAQNPPSSTDSAHPSSQWDAEKLRETEKDGEEELEELDDAWPITYHYLTFDTELPNPTSITPRNSSSLPAPEPPDLVKFTSPFLWSESRKNFIIWLSCIATMFTAFTAGAYSPGAEQMTREWNVSNVAFLVGITTFTTGFGIAPMVLAPFSEINGRRPVFIVSGFLFVVCQLCCAVTQSYGGMLAARFFVGVGGSTFSTMVGGVVSDIYHTADRNTPMALFSASALCGTGLGPLVTGFIAQNTSWRWMFWLQLIIDGVLIAVVTVSFKETRGSVLLSRKGKVLNKWYEEREKAGYFGVQIPVGGKPGEFTSERIRWKVKSDEERTSLGKMIGISCYRPFHLLFTEPVVFFFSLWVSFSWGILYLTLAAVPLVFRTNHGFNIQQSGAVFSAVFISSVFFAMICIYQEKIAKKYGKLTDAPEARLYFSCYQSALMPIGLFLFGWTCSSSIHWIVPTIAIGLATMGIFSIYLAVFNYLADTYHRYASSALAAQSFCRNIMGGIFPLVTTQLYTNLGFGPASSLLGGIGALLTLVPWILMIFGPRIRARSKFASDIRE